MLGRRSLVGMLLAYAGLVGVVVLASRVHACLGRVVGPRADRLERPTPPELQEFLGDVAPGATLGRWAVVEVGPLRDGNLRVELRAGGERVALTLTRRAADRPGPVAGTATLAIYPAVHDLAGHTPTPAEREVADAVAAALAGREAPDVLLPLH
jgi:hypothetical protein